MKIRKQIALLMAVCLTAVFYAACGGGNYEVTVNYPADNSMKSAQGSPSLNGKQGQSVPQAVAEAEAGDEGYDGADADFSYDSMNNEEYAQIIENDFVSTGEENTSTFSIDVDTASYSNVRRMIEYGYDQIPADAVRIEEMINYFNYDYPSPEDDSPFSVTTELYDCPWNDASQLMLIGLQADKIDMTSRDPMNLVFLIDVSGSMFGDDRLGLVQKAVNMLAENLNANDTVSIVTYAGYESVVLEGASGSDTQAITEAINGLEANGSTYGEAGIKKAYEIAEKYFIQGGNNRVLLATDGDLNVGVSSSDELKKLVEKERDTGVHLSVLGFGMGNYKDDRLEALADNGNGNYAYIDSELEARKVLVQEMGGTFYTVAKDVKLQLEFDSNVSSYRLIGYENRVLANEDFNNDKVDAGEIGAGHSVTALYEIVPSEDLVGDNLATLSMRYKAPDGDQSLLKQFPISYSDSRSDTMQKNLAFASAVTEFGMLLRNSQYAGIASYSQIQELLAQTDIDDDYRREFVELVNQAYQMGMLPDTAYRTDAPVREVPEQNSGEYSLTAYQQSETPVDFPDPDSFVTLTEMYLANLQALNEAPNPDDFRDAAENGICVFIDYAPNDGNGKTFEIGSQTISAKSIYMLINGDTERLVINEFNQSQVYALPKVLKDELMLRMQMLDE